MVVEIIEAVDTDAIGKHTLLVTPEFEKTLWGITKKNTFVFIPDRLYSKIPKEIASAITVLSNTEETADTLLAKDVVFVITHNNDVDEMDSVVKLMRMYTGRPVHYLIVTGGQRRAETV